MSSIKSIITKLKKESTDKSYAENLKLLKEECKKELHIIKLTMETMRLKKELKKFKINDEATKLIESLKVIEREEDWAGDNVHISIKIKFNKFSYERQYSGDGDYVRSNNMSCLVLNGMEIFEKENESYDKDEPYEELIENEYNEIGFKKIKFSLFKQIIDHLSECSYYRNSDDHSESGDHSESE